jgi:Fanconi anemia group M protein
LIIVDSREFKSKVVKELFNHDIMMQSLKLSVGDYLIGEDICVERKSVLDFVDSLIDKRLFEQLNSIKNEYKKPLIIVEGGESIYSVRRVHPNAIRGLIASIIIDYEIPIFFSSNESDTAQFLITLLKRSNKSPKPITKTISKVLTSDVQESIVQSIPGIGVKATKGLLKSFGSLKNLFNASKKDLEGVDGVGKKTAEEIYKTANKEYKD